jgi:hypothetical protein
VSPTLRRQKLEAALSALDCAVSNMDDAQVFADSPNSLPDVDGLLDLAIRAIDDAKLTATWALKLLEAG